MSLFIASLNSGSNGNCYYVANQHEAILVDVGISCREVERRMHRLGLSVKKIKAIFISHEHSDHIKGVSVFSKKYQVPVYITSPTLSGGGLAIEPHLIFPFSVNQTVTVGRLLVKAFSKYHDAADPHSFTVQYGDTKVGVFTDIGRPCDQLIEHFKQCHAAFLEANYDEELLDKGRYPFYLKRRIRGGYGHLSNTQALDVFKSHKPVFMSHLFLAHLSKDNNCPNLVTELFTSCAGETQVVVASRYEESGVYEIGSESKIKIDSGVPQSSDELQYTLF
jgi:phosphoribosyl 1,2-cyclic phosphodiesterase